MLECVVNVSEGRDSSVIEAIAEAAGDQLLDVQSDPDHNRAVITLGGRSTEEAARDVARRTVELVDLRVHTGVHPRIGALDVVPFVPVEAGGRPASTQPGSSARALRKSDSPTGPGAASHEAPDLAAAVAARDRFAVWAGDELALPCFLYGPERSLPEVRRRAFVDLSPDTGPRWPHPTAGACAVGARYALVAYNLFLSTTDLAVARSIAREVRGPHVRALGLEAGGTTQVSLNLVEPMIFGPAEAFDAVEKLAREAGTDVIRAELVGLLPKAVLEGVHPGRRRALDLGEERTIEARMSARRPEA